MWNVYRELSGNLGDGWKDESEGSMMKSRSL